MIDSLYTDIGLFIFFLWAFACLARQVLNSRHALLLASGVAMFCLLALRQTPISMFTLASLGPFGTVFPALLLRHLWRQLGRHVRDFSTAEILVLTILFSLFIFASIAWLPGDPYALGYAPFWGSTVALALLLYCLATGRVFLAAAVLVGQLAWTFDVGSTNIFDHVSHGLMLPTLLLMSVQRIIRFIARASSGTITRE